MADKIKLTLRQNSGTQFEVEVDPKATVKELKIACQDLSGGISAEEMRLIFKGKILKDEQTLDEYKIENGVTLHLVKGKGASTGTTSTTATASSSSGDAGTSSTT